MAGPIQNNRVVFLLSHCAPNANHNPGDCILCDYYEARGKSAHQYPFPHCDAYILHEPGICEFCDDHASDMQKWRQQNDINFTGQNDPNKKPCPATTRRTVDNIHKWYGNVPSPKTCPKCGAPPVYINLALACPKHGLIK